MNNNIKKKDKNKLYKTVFIPTLTYGHQIWYPRIKGKKTYLKKLGQLQSLTIKSLLGYYKITSSKKLMEIIEVLPFEEELDIIEMGSEIIKELRKEEKENQRKELLEKRTKIIKIPEGVEIKDLIKKEAIWFLVKTGSFATTLKKIGLVEDDICRLCRIGTETTNHLLVDCQTVEKFRNKSKHGYLNNTEFEKLTTNIIKKLYI